jgi:hypothetical protein
MDAQIRAEVGEPSEEGRKRYPPDGVYRNGYEVLPCTCQPSCPEDCGSRSWTCFCEACIGAANDLLDFQLNELGD